jgi:hypothetical protein
VGCALRSPRVIASSSDNDLLESIPPALERLSSMNLDVTDLKLDYQRIRDSRSFSCTGRCAELWDSIWNRGQSRRVISKTDVKTQKTGALVRYQSLGQRQRNEAPWTFKRPTNSDEDLVIGAYYVWTERDGKSTSDPASRYILIKPREEIVIVER